MYFYSKDSLHKIKKRASDPYIIVQLRDPVERAISQYRLRRADGRETRSFLEACQREYDNIEDDEGTEVTGYVYRGLYGIHISNIKSVFGAEKLKVTFFRKFSDAENQVVSDITSFMGLTPICLDENRVYNRSTKQKYSFLKKVMVKTGLNELAKKLTTREKYQKIRSYFMYEMNQSNDYIDVNITESEKKAIYEKFFKSDIKKLENIIGDSLDEWRR
jgi:hypothetical protein